MDMSMFFKIARSWRTLPLTVAIVLLSCGAALGESKSAESAGPWRWYDPRRYVERVREAADGVRRVEIVEMLSALAHGQPPDAGKGWFHDGQSRYGWQWLAERYDANDDGEITPDEFPPEAADLLATLDRDGDGKIKAGDLDWSSKSPYVQQMTQTRRLFGPIDRDRNGHVTKEEWSDFFDRAALDAASITPADLQAALFPPPAPGSDDDPSPLGLLTGFVTGELGSISEGPKVGGQAPDFELSDHKHERRIRLAPLYEKKPVVLIFGSFT
jgi:hypothetical protein